MTTCEVCGESYEIGEWPWCPHGYPSGGVKPDTLPGGAQWIENLGEQPVWVESKTQLREEARKRGLRWDPKPQKPGTTPFPADHDCRGRFNGGRFPEFRSKDDGDQEREK